MRASKLYEIEEIKALKCGYSPIGVPKYQVHLFFVDGLLIDTGPSRMEKAVLKFAENNVVKQVFVTHHHEDHTGNLAALKKQLNVPFWASEKCSMLMKNPPKMSMPPKIFWGNRGAFHLDVLEKDILETENYKFQLIPLPGHAEDMFGLYEKEKGWLFSADAYVHTHIRYFFYRESVKQQIETIRKLLQLDFEILFCAHNPQVTGGKKKLEKKLHFFENFYAEVAALHKKQFSSAQILRKMELKEYWFLKIWSGGHLSVVNMVNAVIKDEMKNTYRN